MCIHTFSNPYVLSIQLPTLSCSCLAAGEDGPSAGTASECRSCRFCSRLAWSDPAGGYKHWSRCKSSHYKWQPVSMSCTDLLVLFPSPPVNMWLNRCMRADEPTHRWEATGDWQVVCYALHGSLLCVFVISTYSFETFLAIWLSNSHEYKITINIRDSSAYLHLPADIFV